LGVEEGIISVANEVVVLKMVRGAGSTSARGLRRPARRRGHSLKMLLMRFAFLSPSILFGATTYA
jgi:hypothetical protein